MKIWFTHKNLFFILFFLGIHLSNAQVLYNNGATIKVNTGGIVMVKGSAENAAGTYTNNGYTTIDQNITNGDTLQGNGTYEILGHWINNAYLITDLTNSSLVWLNGTASQNIQGTQISLFWNIELSNGLEKIQMINSGSKNSLNLHNQILRADQYSFEVFNTQTNSVLRDAGATYGFVQANLGGKLIRNSALSSTYLFPVGSNVGVLRYRPVELTPTNTLANRYAVRMANVEAGTEGLNRNLHDAEICLLEPDFYHQIQRLTGSTSVLLQAFYEPISDGSWLGLSQWNGAQWNHMASGVHNIGSPFNSVQLANWNNFSTDPYIFDITLPIVSTNPDTTICNGASITLTASGAVSYTWTNNLDATIFSGNPFAVNPTQNTIYVVTGTNGTCSSTDTVHVAINNIAIASVDTTWSDCGASNATATVNASGGDSNYTYLWGTTPAQTTITATGLGVGTVQVTVTDHNGSGCTAIGSATIGESGAPTVSVLSSASQVCPDGSVTLTASGADSYTWSSTNGVFNPISANTNPIVLEQVTQLTQVTVSGTSSGCTDVETIQIDIYPAISTDTPQYVCNGTNTQYQVSFEITGGDPTSYGVLPVGGNIASTAPYIYTSDWIASGQAYSYQVFDIHQCDTLVMAGTHDCSCPVVAQMLNGNDTICSGGSAQIEVQLSGGAFPYSLTYSDGASNQTITGINASPYYITVTPSANTNYSLVSVLDGTCSGAVSGHAEVWVNMLHIDNLNVLNEQCGLDNGSAQAIVSSGWGTYTYQWNTTPVQINATASNLSAGSYSVTVTDQNGSGCSVVGSVMVTDQTQIVVSIQSSGTSVCNGGSIQLAAIGAANYTWLPNDGSLDTQTSSSVFASPNQTTNYIVTGTLGTCSDQAQISISVGQTPVIAVGTLDASCGQNDGAAWVSITGTPGGQINWSNAQTNDTIENLAAGNYSVTVTYNGCQSQESVHVNQHGGLNIQITPSASTLCSSGQVSLLASGATNYTWSSTPNIGIDYSNSNPLVVNINQTTVFHVVGESLGCTGERSIEITVVKPPVVKVDPDSICRGDSVLLSIQANTGFRWLNLPNGYDPYQANHMLAPTQTTTYQVQVDNGVCPSAIYSAIVVVHPLPNVQIVASENPIWGGESTVLTAVGAESYQWLPIVSVEYPYAESNLVHPIKNTKYTVVGTDINGCISFDTLTVAVMHNDNFYIPNVFSPNGDGENDKLFVRGTGFNTMYFVVYDRWGEKVFETKDFSQGWDGTYRGQALDPAVFAYFVKAVFWDGTEHSENGSVTLVK